MSGVSLNTNEVRRRAAGGAALLVVRGGLILCFGVVANLVLARLLAPRDFGVVALGTVLFSVGGFLSDGGLGAGLIRRAEPPRHAELEAVNAAQLGITVVLAAGSAAVGAGVGGDGLVVAAMVATLPITILKVPSIIMLERALRYRPIATVDLLEALAFYAVSLLAVALGLGVWGFAVGMAVRAVAGTAMMARVGPVGLVRPRWSWPDLRPLLRFGAKFQALVVTAMVRDQSLNVGLAVVAGVPTLGVWNLAWRVVQVPLMVFQTIGRIGYPTMARLLGAGEPPKPVLERGVAAVSAITGALVVAVAGFAPALPVLVGPGWGAVPAVLLWSGLAMIASFPIAVMSNGYLFAIDAGGAAVKAGVMSATVWVCVALALAPTIGAPAGGVGWCAAATLLLAVLARATAKRSGAAIGSSVLAPTVIGAGSAVAGWLVARGAGGSVPAGILGAAVGELLLLTGLGLTVRSALADTLVLARDALGGFAANRDERASVRRKPAAEAAPVPPPGERQRISIALATYNSERFLDELLASLTRQTRPPDELVVHDDASQDATLDILDAFAKHAPFEVRIERAVERGGHVEGFLRAARACTGDVVAFCDSDDVWVERKLEICQRELEASAAQVALHTVRVVDAELREIAAPWPPLGPSRVVPRLGITGVNVDAPGMAIVFRRGMFDALDPAARPPSRYGLERQMVHDEWVLFIGSLMGAVAIIDEPLVLYRQHGGNETGWFRRSRAVTLTPVVADYAISASYCRGCADYLASTRNDDPSVAARIAEGAAHYAHAADNWALRLALYDAQDRRTRARLVWRLLAAKAYRPMLTADGFGRRALVKDVVAGVALRTEPRAA